VTGALSNMNQFDKPIPCTILDEPQRVRLFIEDSLWLHRSGIEANQFIRSVVHKTIEDIKKVK